MTRIVLSASRRTDIPAFFMPWFMAGIDAGQFEVQNPYNGQTKFVAASPQQVHSIVFWSKNFGPFLDQGYAATLVQRGYRLFFNFTINSTQPVLEPGLPPLNERLEQLTRLADAFGPDCVQWRFDPICFFRERSGQIGNNLDQFGIIARHAAQLGLKTCITSFVDLYRKVLRRVKENHDLELFDPPMAQKVETIAQLADQLSGLGMKVRLCSEKDLLALLPPNLDVTASACIPNDRLISLFGPGISLAQDSGQRKASGCMCGVSKDIGSYSLHPCRHNCLFCYANPACDTETGLLQQLQGNRTQSNPS
jgi:hypothetical protein